MLLIRFISDTEMAICCCHNFVGKNRVYYVCIKNEKIIMNYKMALSAYQRELKAIFAFTIMLAALFIATGNAYAKDLNSYCISCKGPERVYHCKLRSLKPTANARLGTWCVTKISGNFNHNSCTITKINPDICEGRRVTYMYNPAEKPPAVKASDNSRILPNKGKNITSHKAISKDKLEKVKSRPEKKAVRKEAEENKKTTLPPEKSLRQASVSPTRKTNVKPRKRKRVKRRRKKRPRDDSFSAKIEREYQSTRRAIIRSRKRTVRCFESYFKDC